MVSLVVDGVDDEEVEVSALDVLLEALEETLPVALL